VVLNYYRKSFSWRWVCHRQRATTGYGANGSIGILPVSGTNRRSPGSSLNYFPLGDAPASVATLRDKEILHRRSQRPLGLKEIWTTNAADVCPLTLTTYWVEHAFWGVSALPYHRVNVLLHGACAVLLWQVLRSLRVPGAWLGAVLWALHPVQVESVAWVTEMKNTESGFYFLLSVLFFVKWLRAKELRNGQSAVFSWRWGLPQGLKTFTGERKEHEKESLTEGSKGKRYRKLVLESFFVIFCVDPLEGRNSDCELWIRKLGLAESGLPRTRRGSSFFLVSARTWPEFDFLDIGQRDQSRDAVSIVNDNERRDHGTLLFRHRR
jgi:hypothetical protein